MCHMHPMEQGTRLWAMARHLMPLFQSAMAQNYGAVELPFV